MIEEKPQFQWQQAPARPKLRRAWNNTTLKHSRNQGLFSLLSDKPKKLLLNRGVHFSEAFSSHIASHPHQRQSFWVFDVQKPKHGARMKDILSDTVLSIAGTNLPPTTNRQQKRLLLEERGALLDLEDAGTLSVARAIRLRHVEQQLDWLENQDPVEQEADRRLAQTGDNLDEILSLLRSLPRRDLEDTAR